MLVEKLPVRPQVRVGGGGGGVEGKDSGYPCYLEHQSQPMLCVYIDEQMINKQNLVGSLVAFLARQGR